MGIINYRDSLRLRSPTVEVLTLAAPITLGQLPNPLIYNQTAYLQSGHNMRVSFSDAVNLRSSLSGAQKEKDSTANATLWRKSDLLYEELQELKNLISLRDLVRHTSLRGVVSYCSINLPSLRGLVRLPDNIGLVSYCSINLPSLRGGVNQGNNIDLVSYYSDNHVNNVHSVSYCSDDALVLRCRRLISARIATEINCPVLSLCSFVCSIPSISSCSTRTVTDWDFAFFEPVAISTPHVNWCKTVYTKKLQFKRLTCKTPCYYHVSYTKACIWCENNEAPKCGHTDEASNQQPLYGVTIMAIQQHNQTRLKFTFLIASGTQRLVDIHPVRLITVLADCEGEARLLAGKSSLVFVSRQGVSA
ncbi:conserved protein of unknown function [Xenorhabdus bovienii]|uniref:Uncharacterized protein n=2 Tax=Xenorhabdus bovienii TaxID=40576 RepID=A0A0B6X6Q0_XENBV|nr:conserved protein of unknown function [Xenorhabdus bovienii]